MLFLDLTLPTVAENLALDEALLLSAEASSDHGTLPDEYLRIWESWESAVIVGRAGKFDDEVNVDYCQQAGVPIYRRASGGGAVVIGPGCLMYAVVLSYDLRPALRMVDQAHEFVLETLLEGLRKHVPNAVSAGTSDLALDIDPSTRGTATVRQEPHLPVAGLRKFSGNSLRCRRTHMLYHGTMLYDFPLYHVEMLLKRPPRQPEYRAERSHYDFVTNLPLDTRTLRQTIRGAWPVVAETKAYPRHLVEQLVRDKYERGDW